jgi:hypothetical protein
MTKHYPREERLAFLAMWKLLAKTFPDRCFVCGEPGRRHQIVLRDFLGGEDEEDGVLEAAMCGKHVRAGAQATQAILTTRARRS